VIGSGGKVIREIVEKTGAKINIEDDGTVKVASADGKSIEAAIKWIKSITDDPEVGEIYQGTVVKTVDLAHSSTSSDPRTAWCTFRSWRRSA
jgi:polyribonucleotide nucleotidyltransferase